MEESRKTGTVVPRWYIAMREDQIVGGVGVIENDFHDRKDLSPNVCALYVEDQERCKGIAGKLLERVCADMWENWISPLYLLADHSSFYERYGREFLCLAQGDDEEKPSRMHIQP